MIDLAHFRVISGAGGSGAVSFRREKFVPRGGPDGGDGGRGGDVILRADERLTTLASFRHRQVYRAQAGKRGGGGGRHGANVAVFVLLVPVGTVVEVVGGGRAWDIDVAGVQVSVARGG